MPKFKTISKMFNVHGITCLTYFILQDTSSMSFGFKYTTILYYRTNYGCLMFSVHTHRLNDKKNDNFPQVQFYSLIEFYRHLSCCLHHQTWHVFLVAWIVLYFIDISNLKHWMANGVECWTVNVNESRKRFSVVSFRVLNIMCKW